VFFLWKYGALSCTSEDVLESYHLVTKVMALLRNLRGGGKDKNWSSTVARVVRECFLILFEQEAHPPLDVVSLSESTTKDNSPMKDIETAESIANTLNSATSLNFNCNERITGEDIQELRKLMMKMIKKLMKLMKLLKMKL